MAKTFTIKQIKSLPKYVRIGKVALRLHNPEIGSLGWRENYVEYYRDGGIWSVDIKIKDNKVFAICPDIEGLHKQELIPTTKSKWQESNKGYIGTTTKAYSIVKTNE